MQQPVNICFYSNKCQWSKAFVTEIAQTPWKGLFRYICVDPSPSRPPLPGWLKKTPTLVIAGEPEPRTDSDVMNWLYEKRMKEGGGGGGGQAGGAAAAGAGEPEAFNPIENTSFFKGLSYVGVDADTSTQGDGGMSMPGAFSFLGGGAAAGDRMSQDFPGASAPTSQRRSKKEEMFDKQMEAYQRERETGMPRGPARQ
jgi:hypothetical protein